MLLTIKKVFVLIFISLFAFISTPLDIQAAKVPLTFTFYNYSGSNYYIRSQEKTIKNVPYGCLYLPDTHTYSYDGLLQFFDASHNELDSVSLRLIKDQPTFPSGTYTIDFIRELTALGLDFNSVEYMRVVILLTIETDTQQIYLDSLNNKATIDLAPTVYHAKYLLNDYQPLQAETAPYSELTLNDVFAGSQNLVTNGTLTNADYWHFPAGYVIGGTSAITDYPYAQYVYYTTTTLGSGAYHDKMPYTTGHQLYFSAYMSNPLHQVSAGIRFYNAGGTLTGVAVNTASRPNLTHVSLITSDAISTQFDVAFYNNDYPGLSTKHTIVSIVYAIDLTETFGAGNEPTKSDMDIWWSQYVYWRGELDHTNLDPTSQTLTVAEIANVPFIYGQPIPKLWQPTIPPVPIGKYFYQWESEKGTVVYPNYVAKTSDLDDSTFTIIGNLGDSREIIFINRFAEYARYHTTYYSEQWSVRNWYYIGDTKYIIEDPTLTGFVFDGWFYKDGTPVAINPNGVPTELKRNEYDANLTYQAGEIYPYKQYIYAHWSAVTDPGEPPDENIPTPTTAIETILTNFGLFNFPGLLLVYLIITLLVNSLLVYFTNFDSMLLLVVNAILTAIFMFMNLLPIVMALVLIVFYIIGILFLVRKGGSTA